MQDLTQDERKAFASFKGLREYGPILGLLKRRLEKSKTALVRAKGDVFVLWQGRAQEQEELIEVFTSNEEQK